MTKVLTKKEYFKLPEDERQIALLIDDIITAKEDIAKNIMSIGDKLYIAKQLIPHGEWEAWLAEKVDFSIRTAQTYIKTYKFMMDLPEELDQTLTRLDSSKLIEIATIKKDDIEEFVTNTHEVNGIEKTIEEMSVRELKEVIKDNKKSKKKPKDKNADVCVNETDKVIDVDFKESQEDKTTLTEEQKLAQLIKDQQELEQQLKLKQRQARETKESILKNKKSLDLKVEFEEVIEPFLTINTLNYNIYLVRNEKIKELIFEKCSHSFIEKLNINDNHDYIISQLSCNKNLLQEEKDFIIGECLKFKETATKTYEEINKKRYEKINEDLFDDDFYDNLQDKINEEISRRKHLPQENQDLKKEFIIAGYKALAKKYHPDTNQGSAEAEDKFKAIGILKDTLLQQNLLN